MEISLARLTTSSCLYSHLTNAGTNESINISGGTYNVSYSAAQFLLTSSNFSTAQLQWGNWLWAHPIAYKDRIIVQTPSKNYTTSDTYDLLLQSNCSIQAQIFLKTQSLGRPLLAPKANFVCVYGEGLPSPVRYVFANDSLPQMPSKVVEGSGDGQQDLVTNSWCLRWRDAIIGGRKHQFAAKAFPGVSHDGILKDEAVFSFIKSYMVAGM